MMRERRHRGLGQLLVRRELKRAGRQRVEVEGAENQCEGKLLENVDEDEERRTDQGAAEQGQIHLPQRFSAGGHPTISTCRRGCHRDA